MELNREIEEEIDSSKVLYILKKTLKSTVEDHLNTFAVMLDDVKKLSDQLPPLFKYQFTVDEVK